MRRPADDYLGPVPEIRLARTTSVPGCDVWRDRGLRQTQATGVCSRLLSGRCHSALISCCRAFVGLDLQIFRKSIPVAMPNNTRSSLLCRTLGRNQDVQILPTTPATRTFLLCKIVRTVFTWPARLAGFAMLNGRDMRRKCVWPPVSEPTFRNWSDWEEALGSKVVHRGSQLPSNLQAQ